MFPDRHLASQTPVEHAFDFGTYGDNQDIELMNYRYGDSKLAATRVPDFELENGHIAQGGGISGIFPVGDSIYVKWRVKPTGEIYEDTVDLKSRLPSDMEGKRVHFLIKEKKLYIYVILKEYKEGSQSECPVYLYKPNKCMEIYPDNWKNF